MRPAQRTPATTPARRRAGLRSIVPLAGLLALALVADGVIGLFGMWSVNRVHDRAFDERDALMADLEVARDAQLNFKIQVQEWKDVLLRGDRPADHARHLAAFEARAADVDADLNTLRKRRPEEAEALGRIIADHQGLMRRYRAALAAYVPDDPLSPRRVDDAVRGIDRQFVRDIDGVAGTMLARGRQRQAALHAQTEARYAALRRVLLWGLAGCVALVGFFLWLVVRRDRPSAG